MVPASAASAVNQLQNEALSRPIGVTGDAELELEGL
jgi:hypothetical protein